MEFRWHRHPEERQAAASLSRQLGMSPLLAQCLINRGMRDAGAVEQFLQPTFRTLSDPFALPDMDRAVVRLLRARKALERVVLFGDYDVDGITATAILMEVMEELGWQVDKCLPHRHNEGAGFSLSAIDRCLEENRPDLILAIDCGSTAIETIEGLRQRGIDVIVLDHHQVSEPLPAALALVNPHRSEGEYRELSAAGLAFKLSQALVIRCRELKEPPAAYSFDLKPLLDLVALGTVADMAPLVGENRILVTAGLRRLNRTRRAGLLALMEVAELRNRVDITAINCQLGPRINASGRMEDPQASFDLIRCRDHRKAKERACRLDACNRERQSIEREVVEVAMERLEREFDAQRDRVIVLGNPGWHIGVVGIVASRILTRYCRPVLVFGGEKGILKGSGRSVEGFDLTRALHACRNLLVEHGGHAMAAGLTIAPGNLDAFRIAINRHAREHMRPEHLVPTICIDAEVPLGENTPERLRELESLQPFGRGNQTVRLSTRGLFLQDASVRTNGEGRHARFRVTDGIESREVVWWNRNDADLPSGRFALAYEPCLPPNNGGQRVQLRLLHWRPDP